MLEAQNKIVSIEAFRASRTAGRSTGTVRRGTAAGLSPRSVEHRERMLRFMRMAVAERIEAGKQVPKEGREGQGRLLL